MKNEHDRLIREKLAAASPEALGYRPDREHIWAATGRKRKRQVRRPLLWLTHAAALVAGVMLGAALLARYSRPGPAGSPSVTIAPKPAPTVRIPASGRATQHEGTSAYNNRQTVISGQPEQNTGLAGTSHRAPASPAHTAAEQTATRRQDRIATRGTTDQRIHDEDTLLPAGTLPVAAVPDATPGETGRSNPPTCTHRRMRTIHLADIGNENSGQATAAHTTTAWERFFSDRESGQDITAAPAVVFHDYITRSRK